MSLDNNERSSYQARELKTVYLDIAGNFVRLLVHQCHTNKYNLFNQIGIVAVNLIGAEGGGGDRGSRGRGAGDNGGRRPGAPLAQGNAFNDLSVDLNLDAQTATKLKLLSDAKNRAVENEDYALAKQIKVVEGELRLLGARLAQLDIAKRQAVASEDFDKAINFKGEMDALRAEIEQMVREIHIPGITDNRSIPSYDRNETYASPRGGEVYSHQPVRAAKAPAPPVAETSFDEMPVGGGNFGGGRYDDYDVNNEQDRPIKPKISGSYTDEESDQQTAYKPAAGAQAESFPPGSHPLEGVSGALELPSPEVLTGKAREMADLLGISALIGEYRARCLFSKTWALREAAVSKTRLMIADDEFTSSPGLNDCVKGIAGIVRIGADDKFAGVFFESVNLLDDLLGIARNVSMSRSAFAPLAEPIVVNLIEKLSDGGERIRKTARKGLENLAASSSVGPSVVSSQALKALPAKQKTAWRPIMARIQLLTDLISQYGVGHSGISVDSAMNYVKNLGAFAHSNAEVRDAAKAMTVALQKVVGTDALESHLSVLRPKQKEEYLAAFENEPGPKGSARDHADEPPSKQDPVQQKAGKPKSIALNHVTHSPGGKVHTSADRSQYRDSVDASSEDYTVCSFCGTQNRGWNEDALDLHYWKECPLLCPCPACAQIIEIAGLPDHLLSECEQKTKFRLCGVTNLAIRVSEFDSWSASPNCRQAPAHCMYCPLCLATVEDTDDAWREHLVFGCPQNPRSKTKSGRK